MTFNKWLNSANIFWRGRFVIIFINGLTSPYIYPFPDVAGSSRKSSFTYTHAASIFRRNYLQRYKGLIITFCARRNGKKSVPLILSAEISCGRKKLRHSDRCKKYRYLLFHTLLCRKEMTVIFFDVFYSPLYYECYVSVFDVRPCLQEMVLYFSCLYYLESLYEPS